MTNKHLKIKKVVYYIIKPTMMKRLSIEIINCRKNKTLQILRKFNQLKNQIHTMIYSSIYSINRIKIIISPLYKR